MSSQMNFTRLLAVIVVFERNLDEVLAWPFLRKNLVDVGVCNTVTERCSFLLDHVLIYDNSLQASAKPEGDLPGCTYIHDPSNVGTAGAYARACIIANQLGIDWLLLLDQDTKLPCDFLYAASTALINGACSPCALVPWVFQDSRVVSPALVTILGSIAPLEYKATTSSMPNLTAISSGSFFHVPTLTSFMPMPNGLWLDYVDHWIFSQLSMRGLTVVIFDAPLHHNLSVLSLESLSQSRLNSILDGEAVFLSMLGIRARLLYPFRLVARVIRYSWVRPELAKYTFAWIYHRIRCHL